MIDMLRYLKGDGRQYYVANTWGAGPELPTDPDTPGQPVGLTPEANATILYEIQNCLIAGGRLKRVLETNLLLPDDYASSVEVIETVAAQTAAVQSEEKQQMRVNWMLAGIMIVALLLMAGGVLGQESTATVAPGGDVIVVDPADDVSLPSGVLTFIAGIATGAATALIGAFTLVGKLKNDPAAINAIEWLGKSIPADALDKINELGRTMQNAGWVLEEVSDGEPYVPPGQPQAFKIDPRG